MSTLAVTAERLTIHPHPNADVLELAQVGEYRAVVPKDKYRTGDWAFYIPEQSIVPDALIEELGLTGKLAGKDRNRVKAVRLRGELSQGIVCLPKALDGVDLQRAAIERVNFAEILGITKWVPEVPSSLSGTIEAAPDLMRWIEIENIKRFPDIFIPGEMVEATEKIHGSCMVATLVIDQDRLYVSSKGYASKSLALQESETNLYWRSVRAHNGEFEECMRNVAEKFSASRVAFYGEVYGAGVQDLHYAATRKDSPGFVLFDVVIDGPTGKRWLERSEMRLMTGALDWVPVLYEGPYDYQTLTELASGDTELGDGTHIREGLVVRSIPERRTEVTNGRAIAKFVSDAYITRSGGTEYE